jgi:hypothetical protein
VEGGALAGNVRSSSRRVKVSPEATPTLIILLRLARKTGRTESDTLRESFSAHLWKTQSRTLQRYFRPRAKKAGILTEKDVFRLVS